MAKLNLNTYPYFDDFDETNNFHKVLFKPGYAVQARELTQLQTILQDQIKRFSDNIFKEGSVISGCPESTNFNVDVIKILDDDVDGTAITDAALLAFENQVLVGRTNGVRAIVRKTSTGSEVTEHKAVFLQYISQGTSGASTTFVADEVLELESDDTVTLSVADTSQTPVTKGSLFSVGDGIVYANGNFIRHYSQTIVLEKFSATPSKKVGFLVEEIIVTSEDDDTLLDPAQGAFNYTAPGADRYKLATVLTKYPITEPVEGFFILYEVSVGAISRRYDRTQYAELNKTLARRTYDESGDYVVTPFAYNIREHLKSGSNDGVYTSGQGGNLGSLALGVEPGKAYVRGFEYELFATKYLEVVKPLDSLTRESISLSTAYGNYIIVDEVCGTLPVNGALVSLQSGAAGAVTDGDYSAQAAAGSEIGTARIATMAYHSGTNAAAACKYKLYLYDINMTGGAFSSVLGVYYNNGSIDFHADIASAPATLLDTKYSPFVIPTAYDFIKTLQPSSVDNEFVYRKVITGNTVSTSGVVTVSLSGDETLSFSAVPNSTILGELIVVAETNITTSSGSVIRYEPGQMINMTSGDTTVAVSSGTSLTLNVYTPATSSALVASATVTVVVSVTRSNVSPRTKTLSADKLVRLQTTKKLGVITAGSSYLAGTASTSSTTITLGSYNAAAGVDITTEDCPVGSKLYKNELSTIVITNTSGAFSCGASSLVIGDRVTITGTYGGTGSITGYVTGNIYTVSAVTGSAGAISAFTLTNTDGTAIVTTAGTPTGLTYTTKYVLLGTVASVLPKNDATTTAGNITLFANAAVVATAVPLTAAHPNWNMATNSFDTIPSLGLYDVIAIDYVKSGTTSTAWASIASSGTDITDKVSIKNGQKDGLYDMATLSAVLIPESRYVIQLDHFIHSAGAFFCVDSYPLPTQGVAASASQIKWEQIPIFNSTNGVSYDLRNCLDFRPTVANKSAVTSTITSATINPVTYTETSTAGSGLHPKLFTGFTPMFIPHPTESLTTDIEWNIGRFDRVILDVDGNFSVLNGTPALRPEAPSQPNNCMNLGTVLLPPFPALSPKMAKESSRPSTVTRFSQAELQRRFTMADIGVIDKKLKNLETLTKLTFLEQKTINALLYNSAGDERFKNGILVDSFERTDKLNLENPTNNCLVSGGILTARVDSDSIDLEYSSATSSGIYLKPKDCSIVVRQTVSAGKYAVGESVVQATSGATGVVEHAVEIARGGNYKWMRLYLTEVTGTFVDNATYAVVGQTSNSTGLVTYTGITETILATDMRPSTVNVPSDGDIATLAFVHEVFSENPYASEAIQVTNNVVYGYEGNIGLVPAEDIWFEHRSHPEIITQFVPQIVYNNVEVVRTIIQEKEVQVTVNIPVPVIEYIRLVEIQRVEVEKIVEKIIERETIIEIFTCGGGEQTPFGPFQPPDLPAEIYEVPVIKVEGTPVVLPQDYTAPAEETVPSGSGGGGWVWRDLGLSGGEFSRENMLQAETSSYQI